MPKNKLIILICIMVIAVTLFAASLTGCRTPVTEEEESTAEKLEPATLTWYTVGNAGQPDEAAVYASFNNSLKRIMNTECILKVFDWSEYDQQIKTKISSAEEFDICFTSDWTNNYRQNALNGSFMDVSDLLPEYASKKYASIPKWVWDNLKVNGKIYGVINGFNSWQDMFWFRKDLVEQYDFDYSNVKKLADIEPFLESVKKGSGDVCEVPFQMSGIWSSTQNIMYSEANLEQITGAAMPGVIKRGDDSLTLLNQYELPEYVEILKTLNKWFKKGYINADAETYMFTRNSDMIDANFDPVFYPSADSRIDVPKEIDKTKISAVGYDTTFYEGKGTDIRLDFGMSVATTALGNQYVTSDRIFRSINAISSTSKNPERAMMLLELMNSNDDVFRKVSLGILRTHYFDRGHMIIQLMPDSKYAPGNEWVFGDMDVVGYTRVKKPLDTVTDVWYALGEVRVKARTGATPSNALGFCINNDPVQTEYSQIRAVKDEYAPKLLTGSVDPETALPEFIAKLKAAGLEKYFAEIQKQLNDWKASK